MAPQSFTLLMQGLIIIFVFCSLFNIYHIFLLIPNDELCATRRMPWTPVSEGLEYTWRMFPDLTFFTKSDYFGGPVEEVDRNWSELLPGPYKVPRGSYS